MTHAAAAGTTDEDSGTTDALTGAAAILAAGRPQVALMVLHALAHAGALDAPSRGLFAHAAAARATTLLQDGDQPAAAAVLQRARAAGACGPALYAALAVAELGARNRDGALAAVAAGLAGHPDHPALTALQARLNGMPAG